MSTPPPLPRLQAWLLILGVAGVALLPRVGPALRGYHPSHDGGEYVLLARSLARGEGFVLPIRVRFVDEHVDESTDVVHAAYAERAPLWPAVLAPVVGAVDRDPGWPDPRIQLVGVLLAALAAGAATELTLRLARERNLGPHGAAWAAGLAGLAVAFYPSLVRASIHPWAEPLGLVLGLLCVRGWLGLQAKPTCWKAWGALVLGAGLARYARPEAWVLVPLACAVAPRGRRLATVAAVGVLTLGGVLWTGVLAPQLFLLRVEHYELAAHTTPPPPGIGAVVGGIASNLVGQLVHLLTPKNGWLVLPLALLGLRWKGGRPLAWWAALNVVATCAVWSTADPHRFTIVTFVALAPLATIEAEALRRRFFSGERAVFAAWVAVWVLVLGHAAGRELRGKPPPPPPSIVAEEGVARVEDPWGYALVTGRPAVLLETGSD